MSNPSPSPMLQRALDAHRTGRLDEAEKGFRAVLQAEPGQPQALLMLGLVKAQKGDVVGATPFFQKAVAADPSSAEAHLYLAQALRAQDRNTEALTALRKGTEIDPPNGGIFLALGDMLGNLGQPFEAIPVWKKAVELLPRNAEARHNLGVTCMEVRDFASAEAAFRDALAIRRDIPETHLSLAEVLAKTGRSDESIQCLENYVSLSKDRASAQATAGDLLRDHGALAQAEGFYRQCLQASPDHAQALAGLAATLAASGDSEGAIEHFDRAIAARPRVAKYHFERAKILHGLKRTQEAADGYRQALSIDPNLSSGHGNLGAIFAEEGDSAAASASFKRAIQTSGPEADAWRLRAALSLPPIYESDAQIVSLREQLGRSLSDLAAKGAKVRDPYRQIGLANFYLAYHGRENRALQKQIGDFYLQACPELRFEALSSLRMGGRIKVGVCSAFLHRHTVGQIMQGLLEHLSKDTIELVVFRLPGPRDEVSEAIDRSASKVVRLPLSLSVARKAIADEQLHFLFYPDIGMDAFTYFLAFSRLAPVQAAGWGHPDTTGLETVDHWVSCEPFEPADGDLHYTEHLVRLPRIYNYYPSPAKASGKVTREGLGLPADAHLYGCPQSLFKLHPDFDTPMAEVLRRDPKGLVLLSEGWESNWSSLLKKRFAKAIPDVADRILFMPRIEPDRFQSYLALADAIIDPMHFTGGHTTYLALGAGAPIVTWEGAHMRSRMTRGLYAQMGFMDLVSSSSEEFVAKALKLAGDKDWQTHVRSEVSRRSEGLFEDLDAVRHFESYLTSTA